jgi:hypothetical protein
MNSNLERIIRDAVKCNDCFACAGSKLTRADPVDVPQPRPIGPRYWTASPRIVVLLLNPAQGDRRQEAADWRFAALLHAYRDGAGTLQAVFEHQWRVMPTWAGVQRMYLNGYGLRLDETAWLNVAWCATLGNEYPKSAMLDRCFLKHTLPLLRDLAPEIVLVGGSGTHSYKRAIRSALPNVHLELTLHPSHRPVDQSREVVEVARIRRLLADRRAA